VTWYESKLTDGLIDLVKKHQFKLDSVLSDDPMTRMRGFCLRALLAR
jgi:hypothetical protein